MTAFITICTSNTFTMLSPFRSFAGGATPSASLMICWTSVTLVLLVCVTSQALRITVGALAPAVAEAPFDTPIWLAIDAGAL